MQQIIKNFYPVRSMIATLFLTALLVGCNNGEKTTEQSGTAPATTDSPAAVKPDSGSAMKMKMMAKDTLPPLDPSATTRPDDKKTVIKH